MGKPTMHPVDRAQGDPCPGAGAGGGVRAEKSLACGDLSVTFQDPGPAVLKFCHRRSLPFKLNKYKYF